MTSPACRRPVPNFRREIRLRYSAPPSSAIEHAAPISCSVPTPRPNRPSVSSHRGRQARRPAALPDRMAHPFSERSPHAGVDPPIAVTRPEPRQSGPVVSFCPDGSSSIRQCMFASRRGRGIACDSAATRSEVAQARRRAARDTGHLVGQLAAFARSRTASAVVSVHQLVPRAATATAATGIVTDTTASARRGRAAARSCIPVLPASAPRASTSVRTTAHSHTGQAPRPSAARATGRLPTRSMGVENPSTVTFHRPTTPAPHRLTR